MISDDLAYNRPLIEPSNESKGQLFYFDPNVLPLEGWKKLGIREKTITTIQSYLHKGGHFSKPEDLKKIYGLRADEYKRLEPYIRIPTSNLAELSTGQKTESKKEIFSKRTEI